MASNGNAYYLQKRVPKDLASEYPRPTIKRYLCTDYGEAKRKLPVELARLEQEFTEKRRWRDTKPLSVLSDMEVERLTAIWLHDALSEDEDVRRDGKGDDEVFATVKAQVEAAGGTCLWSEEDTRRDGGGLTEREYLQMEQGLAIVDEAERAALARGRTAIVEGEVDDLLDREGVKLEKGAEAYRRLSFAVLKASVRATELMLKRHQGDPVDTPPAPGWFRVPGLLLEADVEGGEPFSVIFERWKLERRPPAKTASDFWAYVRRFIELHGDLRIKAITKPHVVAFKAAMLQYPARPSAKLAKLTVPKLLETIGDDPTVPRLSPRTVRDKALGAIGAILSWGVSNGYRDDNPASGVTVAMGEVQDDPRLPYDIEDLKAIFKFPIFTIGDRPMGGAGEAAKWLPLLGLFTGARLEEMGQCLVADCKEEAGVPFLDLRVIEGGKSLKRNSSRRMVPVHPELIRCGFLAYVEARRKAGDERLFPDLRSERAELTAAWSQWWGRYARKHRIKDKRKVFHSLRHTFKDACRAAGIEEAVYDALQGHRGSSVGRTYGLGYPLPVLAEAMASVRYEGLNLSTLWA